MTPEELTALAETIGNNLAVYHKEYLTTEEAAAYLGLKTSYVHKLMMLRTFPYYKPNGKNCYFRRADLDEWIQRGRISSSEELDSDAVTYCATHPLQFNKRTTTR